MTTSPPARTVDEQSARLGVPATATLGVALLAWALTTDLPKLTGQFYGDGSTYYTLTHSLAEDGDFEFRREDLQRVWLEYPTGPEGIFLKRGRDVQGVALTSTIPFVEIEGPPDWDPERLYFAKSFLFALAAAPFVWLFGTTGFVVFHALLMTICFACAYAFLAARSRPVPAALFAFVFLMASAAPVYMVWLTPDFFNLALVLVAYFFWCYKEVGQESARRPGHSRAAQWLTGPRSDAVAAVLLGMATFSKPTHVLLVLPVLALFALRRQWARGLATGILFATVVVALFGWNVAITGDWNYQGGDRKTFYGVYGGFPFQNPAATFDSVGEERATNSVPVEVLASRDAFVHVLRNNLAYFFVGRHHGLFVYFFPAAVTLALFLAARRERRVWQWLALAGALGSALFLLLYMPFTYSGGGGPVGNRYYLGVYPVFLFLAPPLTGILSTLVAAGMGALFTATLTLNPFFTSVHPAEHPKRWPYRWLPTELTLLNDLPMNVTPSRARQPLGGTPPVLAYFLDDNAYAREGDAFWVRGESRAEMILRSTVALEQHDGREVARPLQIRGLDVQLETGARPNRVTVVTGSDRQTVEIPPNDARTITVAMPDGLPYRRDPWVPSNFVYTISVTSETGFIPMFENGSRDTRFLGVFVRITPRYE